MKIIIAGPLPNNKTNGGVAIFTQYLAKEAACKGNEVLVLSSHLRTNQFNDLKNHNIVGKNIWNILAIIRFKPDLVISSLQYSLLFCFLNIDAVKVHILHGFTGFKYYSNIKFYIMHFIDKVIRRRFDAILANSAFTQLINEEIFDIKCDGRFYIGLGKETIRNIINRKNECYQKKGLLFIGRIVPAKGVEKAIMAFLSSSCSLKTFKIAGYGNELDALKQKYKKYKNINFKGMVNRKQAFDLYRESKVFISLNPSEPYGITYVEAIANGMFVVAPKTGGQVEFLQKFPGRYCLVDQNDESSVVDGIEMGMNSNLSPLSDEELREISFENTYISIIGELKTKGLLC